MEESVKKEKKKKTENHLVSNIASVIAIIGLCLCFFEIYNNVYNEQQRRVLQSVVID